MSANLSLQPFNTNICVRYYRQMNFHTWKAFQKFKAQQTITRRKEKLIRNCCGKKLLCYCEVSPIVSGFIDVKKISASQPIIPNILSFK